ncbi:MAG: hypothetical protein MJ252_24415, partial [archaeon]|nr:hypothetical protein [archaeon]
MESYCYICDRKQEVNHNFSCGHSYCTHCLFHHIFINHIQQLSTNDNIEINCKCKDKGTLDISMNNLHELLVKKVELDKIEKEPDFCKIHNEEIKCFYCKNCHKPLCQICKTNTEHMKHEIVPIVDYMDKIRNFLNDISLKYRTLEQFLENFDAVSNKFKNDMETDFNITIKSIDDLIKNLNNLKVEYAKILKENLEKGVLLLKIVKLFYCNYYMEVNRKESCTDLYTLNYLKDINYEFTQLKLSHNKEMIERLKLIKNESDELSQTKKKLTDLTLTFSDISTNFNKLYSLFGHTKAINSVIQLRSGTLVTGSADYTIRFWDEINGEYKCTNTIQELTGNVIYLYQLKDGRLVSTAKDNNTIKIWDIYSPTNGLESKEKMQCELTLSGHKDSITCLFQLPDDRLVTSSRDKTVCIWEPEGRSFQQKEILTDHTDGVYVVCELSNGKIGSGSEDTTIRIWSKQEAGNYFCSNVLEGHTKGVRALCQLRDGRLASGSEDAMIKIW